MVTGLRSDEVFTYNTGPNINRKLKQCCTTYYCMRVLLPPHMGVMRDKNSFPCEGYLIETQNFSRKKVIYSKLSKLLLRKRSMKYEIFLLQCLDTLHLEQKHAVFSKNPPEAATRRPDCVR